MNSILKIAALVLFVLSCASLQAQKQKVLNGEWVKTTKEERKAAVQPEILNEVVPADFKSYEGVLLVSPTFKAIGMDKFLTKRLDEHYGKPYKVVTIMESMETGDAKFDEVEYQYQITVNSMTGATGNDVYTFMLMDRKNSIVYFKANGTSSFKRYLRKLLE